MGAIETIILVIIFLVPGLIVRLLRNFFVPRKRTKLPRFEYLSEIIIDSVIVSVCAIFITGRDSIIEILEGETLAILKGPEGIILIRYIVSMLVISLFWYFIKYQFIVKLARNILNWWYRKFHGYVSSGRTVWEDYRKDGRIREWSVVSIYKHEIHITTGIVFNFEPLDSDEIAFSIYRQKEIALLMEKYPTAFDIKDEYYNSTTGLRVVWFVADPIKKLWKEEYGDDFTSSAGEAPSARRLLFQVVAAFAVLALVLVLVFLNS